jgi:small subunit ribosomal protein S7
MISSIMQRGKKSLAQRIVYGAFDIIKEKRPGQDMLELFLQAMENAKPRLEVKSRRVGGATYQVPVEIAPARQVAIALRWIRDFAAGRKGHSMIEALASELMDCFDNTGNVIKKRDDTHKMAAANRAFAHYRW